MNALRSATLAVILIFACVLPGCSTPAPAQPAASPAAETVSPTPTPTPTPAPTVDIRGRVTQARRNGQGEPPVGTLVVEGTLEPDTHYDKATIHVGHTTRIFVGRDKKPASFSFIHSGDLIEATFDGPPTEAATESHPLKATATTIVVLEHKP
jgi:hypothetical protein